MCVLLNQYNLKHAHEFSVENEVYSVNIIFLITITVYKCI